MNFEQFLKGFYDSWVEQAIQDDINTKIPNYEDFKKDLPQETLIWLADMYAKEKGKEKQEYKEDRNISIYKIYNRYKRSPDLKIVDLPEHLGISRQRIYKIVESVEKRIKSGQIKLRSVK